MIEIPVDIGRPPETKNGFDNNIRTNSWPVCIIEPCYADWTGSLKAFNMINVWNNPYKQLRGTNEVSTISYLKVLNSYGYTYNSPNSALNLYFIPDSLPTETFTNEYGDTFISRIGDYISEAGSDLSQLLGGRTTSEMVNNVVNKLKESPNSSLQQMGSLAGSAQDAFMGLTDAVTSSLGPGAKGLASMANRLLAGQRVDFPAVWKNSVFQPTYSITVKLYNPNPGNDEDTEKNIIGPLTAILLLALPIGMEETYSWPFFCRVWANGLFQLPAAGISSISVTKGGDQGLVAYNQRLGAVDVRIDFQSLFTTLLAGEDYPNRNCVRMYIDNLKRISNVPQNMYTKGGFSNGVPAKTEPKKVAVAKSTATETTTNTTPRAPDSAKEQTKNSKDNGPSLRQG